MFGPNITRLHHGQLKTEIEDMQLPSRVIRSHYRNGFDHLILRTEAAANDVTD